MNLVFDHSLRRTVLVSHCQTSFLSVSEEYSMLAYSKARLGSRCRAIACVLSLCGAILLLLFFVHSLWKPCILSFSPLTKSLSVTSVHPFLRSTDLCSAQNSQIAFVQLSRFLLVLPFPPPKVCILNNLKVSYESRIFSVDIRQTSEL